MLHRESLLGCAIISVLIYLELHSFVNIVNIPNLYRTTFDIWPWSDSYSGILLSGFSFLCCDRQQPVKTFIAYRMGTAISPRHERENTLDSRLLIYHMHPPVQRVEDPLLWNMPTYNEMGKSIQEVGGKILLVSYWETSILGNQNCSSNQ